ncbi:MAG: DUF3368 domain-containing protein [Verrucomicrobiota bacterium]|nr:DUF3368 domain-containing protein [Verrucomicrobiota bacterium]
MIVVSDASPLICLAKAGHLLLLERLYKNVLIPPEVRREITSIQSPEAEEIRGAFWIETVSVVDQSTYNYLCKTLDSGEAEAIVLALETNADFLLIDERLGRRFAASFDIQVIGLLGVFLRAKKVGLIPSVKPLLEDLKSKSDFWIDESLYLEILKIAVE